MSVSFGIQQIKSMPSSRDREISKYLLPRHSLISNEILELPTTWSRGFRTTTINHNSTDNFLKVCYTSEILNFYTYIYYQSYDSYFSNLESEDLLINNLIQIVILHNFFSNVVPTCNVISVELWLKMLSSFLFNYPNVSGDSVNNWGPNKEALGPA